MKRTLMLLVSLFTLSYPCLAQSDTLFTFRDTIACTIREVTPETIRFSYEGEDLVNTVYQNTVSKIIFRNGRIQQFSMPPASAPVFSHEHYQKVILTPIESEIKGMYKLDLLDAKSNPGLLSTEAAKSRAEKKLKMAAAMMGANFVYLTNAENASLSTKTQVSGLGYTNYLPDFQDFMKKIGDKRKCSAVAKYLLPSYDTDIFSSNARIFVRFTNPVFENGMIYLDCNISGLFKNKRMRVVSFDDTHFYIACKSGGDIHSLKVAF